MKRLVVAAMFGTAVVTGNAQPAADPVTYPAGYQAFEQIRNITVKRDPPIGFVFVNGPAATVAKAEQRPYPYGSVIVMEWRREGNSGKGGEIVRLDVMRKERGFGSGYGADRNGEWEYASYSPDGKLLTGAAEAAACAKCHLKAGASKDFVYAGRFP